MQNNVSYLNQLNCSYEKCFNDDSVLEEEAILFPTINIFSIKFIINVLLKIFFNNHVITFFIIIFLLVLELIFIAFLWLVAYFLVFCKIPIIKSILGK